MRETENSLYGFKLLVAGLLFFSMFMVAMVKGAASISYSDVWRALFTNQSGDAINIIREIRLPRVVAGIFVGAALAVAGAIMQGMTRNPLADPGLLGLTSGASAALAITLAFMPKANYFSIMFACFIGATIAALLVFGISAIRKGGFSPFRIVLAGAAISAFLQAVTEGVGIYFKISKDVSMWTAGGMMGTTWVQLQVIVPFIVVGIVTTLLLARQLTILSLSEEVAVGLGQNINVIKGILFIVIVMLAGASVALVGNLAFIGLMVPHVARKIVGTDYRRIIPMSTILGAITILIADTLSRTINAPYETPVIAVVAVLGLPFFLFIIRKGGKAYL